MTKETAIKSAIEKLKLSDAHAKEFVDDYTAFDKKLNQIKEALDVVIVDYSIKSYQRFLSGDSPAYFILSYGLNDGVLYLREHRQVSEKEYWDEQNKTS